MTRAGLLSLGWLVLVAAAATADPGHPSQLAPLTPTSTFPRFTAAELAAAGFPDHLHAQYWPGWQTLVDGAGNSYGPFTLARGTAILSPPGLDLTASEIRYRGIHLNYGPQTPAAAVLPFVELVDWARRSVPSLIGHDRTDTLRLCNPENLEAYTAQTGQKYWHLYGWREGECVLEPIPTLAARTLEGHAAFALVTEWLLDDARAGSYPAWFRAGLASYCAEYGVHLVNYVAEFRATGQPAIFPVALTDSVLAAPVGMDDQLDRRLFRTASYSAFLMVWELIENRGGLASLQRLVQAVADGVEPEKACRDAYGLGWSQLATSLDASRRPEPLGDAIQPRAPHLRPAGD